MSKTEITAFTLTGLALKTKTWNAEGQSAIDCGSLWQQFAEGKYVDKIPGKLDDEIIAVYHNYEGDHTKPYSYFIGCRVMPGSAVPEGMDSLAIGKATYRNLLLKAGCLTVLRIPGWKSGRWILIVHILPTLKSMMCEAGIGMTLSSIYLLD